MTNTTPISLPAPILQRPSFRCHFLHRHRIGRVLAQSPRLPLECRSSRAASAMRQTYGPRAVICARSTSPGQPSLKREAARGRKQSATPQSRPSAPQPQCSRTDSPTPFAYPPLNRNECKRRFGACSLPDMPDDQSVKHRHFPLSPRRSVLWPIGELNARIRPRSGMSGRRRCCRPSFGRLRHQYGRHDTATLNRALQTSTKPCGFRGSAIVIVVPGMRPHARPHQTPPASPTGARAPRPVQVS